jgi:hypothetical protein
VERFNVEVTLPLTAGVIDEGERVQETVGVTGEMAHVNPTAELKLFKEVTVTTEVVEFPTVVVPETGKTLRLKSGGTDTVIETVEVRFWPFPLPLTVAV